MSHVQRFDHIGITVADLDAATAFFVGLGLEIEGTGSVEGEFVETVCGIPGAHCEITMLRPPDGGCRLELASVRAHQLTRVSVAHVRQSAIDAVADPDRPGSSPQNGLRRQSMLRGAA